MAWQSSSDSRYEVYLLWIGLSLLALYAASRIVTWIAAMVETQKDLRKYKATGEPPVQYHDGPSSSKSPVDEEKIREVLRQVGAGRDSCPSWVAPAIDDWLTSADGSEKDRKRDMLLTRLYWYSAFSTDAFEQRKAVNQIRSAINPWIDETAAPDRLT